MKSLSFDVMHEKSTQARFCRVRDIRLLAGQCATLCTSMEWMTTAAAVPASVREGERGCPVEVVAGHPGPSFRGCREEAAFREEDRRKGRAGHPVPVEPSLTAPGHPLPAQDLPVRPQRRASAVWEEADRDPLLVRFRGRECCPGWGHGECPPVVKMIYKSGEKMRMSEKRDRGLTSGGGGPSTVSDTMFSPRSRMNPNVRFSSRSTPRVPLPLIFRNSSQSDRMRFMCLSKALKVPTKLRPSCRITLIR